MSTILVIEDEADIADLLALHLQRAGFTAILARDGITGLALAKKENPALVLLDLMLPGMDGTRVFKELRRDPRTLDTPVIMLTARAQTADRVAGLELGADDYVTKPFSPKELLLRIKSVLKRSEGMAAREALASGPFRFDSAAVQCYADNRPLDLTQTEYKLFQYLCEHADQLCDRARLLGAIWGYSDAATTRTLDTHIKRLRIKLGRHEDCIETVRGVGYLMRAAGCP